MTETNTRELNTSVLIDTWWNVNEKFVQWWDDDEVVLIDTWWNVNKWCLTLDSNLSKF